MNRDTDTDMDDNDFAPRVERARRDKSTLLILLVSAVLLVVICVMLYKIFTLNTGPGDEMTAGNNAAQTDQSADNGANSANGEPAGSGQNDASDSGDPASDEPASDGAGSNHPDAPVTDGGGSASAADNPGTQTGAGGGTTGNSGGKQGGSAQGASDEGGTGQSRDDAVKLPTTYVVQKGDTLSAISLKFYHSKSHVDLLAKQNNIVFINDMKVGDTIKIPALTSGSASSGNKNEVDYSKLTLPVAYMVQAGDTLYNISLKFYQSKDYADLIAKANKLEADGDLKAGSSLTIPALPDKGAGESGGGSGGKSDQAPLKTLEEHTVQKGETLSSIARAYFGSSKYAADIAKYNQLENGDQVKAGDVLKIPDLPKS